MNRECITSAEAPASSSRRLASTWSEMGEGPPTRGLGSSIPM